MSLAQEIAEALREAGYHSLDDKARALGLCRSTTWTIVASQHKIGRLSHKVRARMLANPDLPVSVRNILHPEKCPRKCYNKKT